MFLAACFFTVHEHLSVSVKLIFFLGGGFDTCVTIQSGFWPCALNGQEALAMLEETHQKDSDYEVILTDWMLPGMDYHTSKPIDVNKVAELLRKYMR